MKNKFTITLVLAIFASLFSIKSEAQNYEFAAGLRLGSPVSISGKYFVSDNGAVEGTVGRRGYGSYSWTSISAAYLLHKDLDWTDGLQWYYGAGAAVYLWNFDDTLVAENSSTTSVGIQGYIGLDYTFADLPINASIDWVPTFFINGYGSGFNAGYGALSIRYIIK